MLEAFFNLSHLPCKIRRICSFICVVQFFGFHYSSNVQHLVAQLDVVKSIAEQSLAWIVFAFQEVL